MKNARKLLLFLFLLAAPAWRPAYAQEPAPEAPAMMNADHQREDSLIRERFHGTLIALVFISAAFLLVIFFRHQAALRLEAAYMDLEEANAKALESARMKTHFIRQVSHEIRTPLNLLAGFAQVLASPDAELDEETRRYLKTQISVNTGRITSLINKMLELSDASSQTRIERTENISAMQIAAEAAAISGISTASYINLDLQLPKESENPILTNKTAAVRALALVLDNARKFSAPADTQAEIAPEARKRVTLRVEPDADRICFVVEDTGIGIEPENAERIFDEFVQLDEFVDGTGIGLTVARLLARRLGGDVMLDSSYSGGARFRFTLPS